MDVAILPSRGASLETAAKGARAASSPPSVSGGSHRPRLMAKGCPAWGESGARPAHGKYLVKEFRFPLHLLFLHFCRKQLRA